MEINPDLAKFYGRTQWTQIDWQQRQALWRKPLALWLHSCMAVKSTQPGRTAGHRNSTSQKPERSTYPHKDLQNQWSKLFLPIPPQPFPVSRKAMSMSSLWARLFAARE